MHVYVQADAVSGPSPALYATYDSCNTFSPHIPTDKKVHVPTATPHSLLQGQDQGLCRQYLSCNTHLQTRACIDKPHMHIRTCINVHILTYLTCSTQATTGAHADPFPLLPFAHKTLTQARIHTHAHQQVAQRRTQAGALSCTQRPTLLPPPHLIEQGPSAAAAATAARPKGAAPARRCAPWPCPPVRRWAGRQSYTESGPFINRKES